MNTTLPLRLNFKINISEFFIRYYYIFVMSFYFLSMFFPILRPGVLASVVMCVIFVSNLKLFTFRYNLFHLLFFAYIACNLFSIVFYFGSNIPISVFFQEFSNSILPVVFFFLGKKSNDSFVNNMFYKYFAISVLIMLLIGIYYYFWPSEVFLRYMEKITANFTIQNYWKDKRLESFIGSTELGSLSVILVVVSLNFIFSNGLKAKYVILYVFSIICSGLSMQRSSMVATIMLIIVWHLHGMSLNKINYKFIFAEIIVFILVVVQLLRIDQNILNLFLTRINRIGSAISERSDSWIGAINNSNNIFFGGGLGSAGHKAIGYSKFFVHDGSYLKILVETGVLGALLFFILIVYTYTRCIFYNKDRIFEISIVSILLFQAIGSNVLAFQTLLPIFWYSVGRIWNNTY